MKIKKGAFLISFLFISLTIYAQNSQVKLLFDMSGDLRNPSFLINRVYQLIESNSLIFENRNDSVSNIFISDYSAEKDSFLTPFPVTQDNFLNINPTGYQNYNEKVIFFQTNRLGNWDIAYRVFSEGIWNDVKIFRDSLNDDINPSVVKGYVPDKSASVVYQRNNSIYMYTRTDTSENNILLLQSSDSLKYSDPSGIFYYLYLHNAWRSVLEIAALVSYKSGTNKIIQYVKDLTSSFDTVSIADEGNVRNPRFLFINYGFNLTYEKIENGGPYVFYYPTFSNNPEKYDINNLLEGYFSNLETENYTRPILSLNKGNSVSVFPYVYDFSRHDSSYVGVVWAFSTAKDTLINTKVNNSKTVIEFVGYDSETGQEINYAVWEDSSSGNINLYALKVESPVYGSVKKSDVIRNFIVYQNYPNPFNPVTTISYEIPKESKVTIKIFDVLGREVETLSNEEQNAGMHEVKWDGENFSSGVYFYRIAIHPRSGEFSSDNITAGDFVSVKKMLLIK